MGICVKKLKVEKQKGTDSTLFARWAFDNKDVDSYEVKWEYTTGNKTKNSKKKLVDYWFEGSRTTVKIKQATYSVPSNALKVKVNVRPVAKTKNDKNRTPKFNGAWLGSGVEYKFRKGVTPNTPPSPTVVLNGLTSLTATVENYQFADNSVTDIDYQVVENDKKVVDKTTYRLSKTTKHVAGWSSFTSKNLTAGCRYKVRVRARTAYGTSPWTDYTDNQYTVPDKVKGTPTASAFSEDSLQITWNKATASTGYEIEYSDDINKLRYSSDTQTDSKQSTSTKRIISGLSSATRWYFRVRGTNDTGNGAWSSIGSQVLATKPSAPTTWTYASKASPGDTFTLNWTHNTQDGSEQEAAEVNLVVSPGGNANTTTITVDGVNKRLGYVKVDTQNNKVIIGTGDNEKKVSFAGTVTDGTTITWKVRTKGIHPNYGGWSTPRTISIYARPTISIAMTPISQNSDGKTTVTGFPVIIEMTVKPSSQKALSASLSVVSKSDKGYYTELANGEDLFIAPGDAIYSGSIDVDFKEDESAPYANKITFTLTPGDIHFEPDEKYVIEATAAMDSGLTATSKKFEFISAIEETPYEPSAEILIDYDALTASIRPFILGEFETETYPPGKFGVYRRESDGSFTPIYTELDSATPTAITDPHPALDYARYRITFRSEVSGAISYTDMAGVPTEETAVVIQWDENWVYFDTAEDAEEEAPEWTGTLLRLPYNIDVSDNFAQDVALVEYIGRENPVSYYGTQKGYTSQWKVEVPKTDVDTLATIRKLARYSGDVYVREPSGTGYFAQVNVSYSISHNNPIIPVSFDIRKVSGEEDAALRRITVTEEETEEESVEETSGEEEETVEEGV